jgi:hypothetical protein
MKWAALAEYYWPRVPAHACSMFCNRRLGFDIEAWSGRATVPGAMAVFGLRLVFASARTAWLRGRRHGVFKRRDVAEGIENDVGRGVPERVCLQLRSRLRHSACSAALVTRSFLLKSRLVHGRRSNGLRTRLRIAVVCARPLTPALSPSERELVFEVPEALLAGQGSAVRRARRSDWRLMFGAGLQTPPSAWPCGS